MKPVLTDQFFISAGEVNAEGELSLPLLTSRIIDIATLHANSLGIGNATMADRDMGWVLARLTIEMRKYPRVNDSCQISTWIENWNRHYSERSFRFENSEGEILGYARTIWMVLDIRNRTNAGLQHLTLPEGMTGALENPCDRQERHRLIVPPGIPIDPNLRVKPLVADREPAMKVFGYSDIDFYRHVNTVRYVEMLLDTKDLDFYDRNMVSRLEMSFMHEVKAGIKNYILSASLPWGQAVTLGETYDNPSLYTRIFYIPRP